MICRHCRGYLSLQTRRRAQAAQPVPPAAAAEVPGENDGEDEVEAEPMANEAQNQNDIQRPRVSHEREFDVLLFSFSSSHPHQQHHSATMPLVQHVCY